MLRLVLSIALLCVATASAQTSKRVALVIGNAAYASGALANPANDAVLIAGALREVGFTSVVARPNLGVDAFKAALLDFQAQASGAEVALIYFAGHGMEANGENWLIPVDAQVASDGNLDREAVRLETLVRAVSGARARIVVLDACRNNPFAPAPTARRTVRRGLVGVEVDDVVIMLAAAQGETADDGGGGNSPFAAALARRLVEPGLELRLMAGRVRDDVKAATGGRQAPFVAASISGDAIFLRPPLDGVRAVGATASLDVAEAQRLLTALGYQPGTADGFASRQTATAATDFLRDLGGADNAPTIDAAFVQKLRAVEASMTSGDCVHPECWRRKIEKLANENQREPLRQAWFGFAEKGMRALTEQDFQAGQGPVREVIGYFHAAADRFLRADIRAARARQSPHAQYAGHYGISCSPVATEGGGIIAANAISVIMNASSIAISNTVLEFTRDAVIYRRIFSDPSDPTRIVSARDRSLRLSRENRDFRGFEIRTATEALFFYEEAPTAGLREPEISPELRELTKETEPAFRAMMAQANRRVFAYDPRNGEGSVLRKCVEMDFSWDQGSLRLTRPAR